MAFLAALIPYMAAAGAAVSAVAAIRSGNMAKGAAEYNADVLSQQAASERQQGVAAEELQRQQARSIIGQQLATSAESGTSLNGSNLDALKTSLYGAEMDALNLRYSRELNATGLQNQTSLVRAQGNQARTGGYLSAAGSLLNYAGSLNRPTNMAPVETRNIKYLRN